MTFDKAHGHHELKPILVGANVSFLNADLKTWSVGIVHAKSTDDRIY